LVPSGGVVARLMRVVACAGERSNAGKPAKATTSVDQGRAWHSMKPSRCTGDRHQLDMDAM